MRSSAPRSQDRTPASATPRDPSLATNYRGSGLVLRVKDDMHLQTADATVRFGPVAQRAKRNGGCIDQLDHLRALASGLPIELACHQAEGLGEDRHGPPFVGIGQGRAHQRTAAEMVMMLAMGVPPGFQS